MKKHTLAALFCLIYCMLSAQVTTEPAIIQKGYTGEIKIIFNPAEGNGGMKNATACYAHTGLITASSNGEWVYAPTWRGGESKYAMTKNESNWVLTIPNIYEYYGCPASEEILKMAFVFNDGPNGSKEGKTADGSDIFVELTDAGLTVRFITPSESQIIKKGESINFKAVATMGANLELQINGVTKKTASSATELTYSETFEAAGDYNCKITASCPGEEIASDNLTLYVINNVEEQARPEGIVNGIYYDKDDDTKVTLCTYAASKTAPAQHVFAVGDFNDWAISNDYQLKRDGNYFWIEITGLEPQKEYAYQFAVIRDDGKTVYIDDLFATKVLHPDDKYEPKKVDPELMDYPEKGNGYVSVLQTGKPNFDWSDATLNFARPDKNNLIIYELWVYDFTPHRDIKAITKRLDYIANLGVNAIELMPICEFDGNYNWGYSPNHYFAPDRAYGSENDIKTFIDECHKRGIAVIMDMVFNHATGLNPMNKLYPWGSDLKDNPWFNEIAPHSDNVYEDWNHGFEPAQDMFRRALSFWLTEYRVDGFRMDLSHGFCDTLANSSVEHIVDYYENGVKAAAEDAYFILEHWGSNMGSERPKLVEKGMLCWNNTNNAYCQAAMAWLKDGDGFAEAHKAGYVSYCESHDEERMQYKAKTYGNGVLKTNVAARLQRVPLTVAFNLLLKGSKMLWQYEELGYDYSINSSLGSSTISEDNRCSKKEQPEAMGWFHDEWRMTAYGQVARIAQLRTNNEELFVEGNYTVKISSGQSLRSIVITNGDKTVIVLGNFNTGGGSQYNSNVSATPFTENGTWYNYLKNSTHTVKDKDKEQITLAPDELRIYTSWYEPLPTIPDTYYFDDYSGIKDIAGAASSFTLSPTITDGAIHIESEELPRRVEVYTLQGMQVYSASHTRDINISGLQSGIYVTMVTGATEQEVFKIVKK